MAGTRRLAVDQEWHVYQGGPVEPRLPGNGLRTWRVRTRTRARRTFVAWLAEAAAVAGTRHIVASAEIAAAVAYGDDAWAFVVATMRILPAAAQALAGVFAAHGQSDFTEATLRALNALGTSDDPSDLLLAIDYRLSHLLVDEFQDTSRAQLALIGRLCEGWEPGDGRTLFAVGDPMQSIYRFRQAEVRLFIESQMPVRLPALRWTSSSYAEFPVAAVDRRLGQSCVRACAAARLRCRSRRSGFSRELRRPFHRQRRHADARSSRERAAKKRPRSSRGSVRRSKQA